MCFFNRIKTEDVYKMVRTKLLAWNTKGIPSLSYRNKDNYYENKYNCANKKECFFMLNTIKDNFRLEFTFSYIKKTKKAWFRIAAKGVDLSYSKEGMRLIREKYKDFDFTFLSDTYINIDDKVCKTVQACFKYLTDCMAKWNSCDLYDLLVDLKKLNNK